MARLKVFGLQMFKPLLKLQHRLDFVLQSGIISMIVMNHTTIGSQLVLHIIYFLIIVYLNTFFSSNSCITCCMEMASKHGSILQNMLCAHTLTSWCMLCQHGSMDLFCNLIVCQSSISFVAYLDLCAQLLKLIFTGRHTTFL